MKSAFLFLLTTILFGTTATFADVKIKSRQTAAGQTTENTTYIKGKRKRTELMGGMMITIDQCDLGRDLQLNPSIKTYMVNAYGVDAAAAQPAVQQSTSTAITAGGTMYITTTTKDTGERKQIFGFTARHIIQTIETESSPEACTQTKSKMEIDAWVIDAEFSFGCSQTSQYRPYSGRSGGCTDKVVTRSSGSGKNGYPVLQKMTMFDASGKETMTMTQEVVEISNATLDQSLFEVPADYREVKEASQLYASAPSATSLTAPAVPATNSPYSRPISTDSSVTRSDVTTATQPKKAGTVRIGLTGVKVAAVGEGITAADLAAAIQNTLREDLKGTRVDVVFLESKLVSAQGEEAKQKECDFVVSLTASHKKGGGFGFGKMLGQVVSQTGFGATGSVVGNAVVGVAATAIVSAANLSRRVKSKDELTLDLTIQPISGDAASVTRQYKARAKADGDDIVSALLEQIAKTVLGTVTK